jgi:two-component system, chemotaxis family, protein-glutamate methylesterase/glutaminase
MTEARIKIIIVDDSPAMQELFQLLLRGQPDFEITAVAGSAEDGWGRFCQSPPDVMLLDLELPGRPGLDLLKRIMRERPTPVVIVSANGGEGSENTIAALAAGAVAFIEKPDSISISVETFTATLHRVIRMSAGTRQSLVHNAPGLEPSRIVSVPPSPVLEDKVIAIGASTGGVAAVQHVLTALARAPLPIIITQHMPAGYTRRFAERLRQVTGYDVKEAEDGDRLAAGRVLIARGDRHLLLAGSRAQPVCRLSDGPAVSGHKPSVDVMFRSTAEVMGQHAVGVLLTGMGRDGAEGLLAMRKAGAHTACESEKSAIVFGMPKAALEIGASDTSLPLPAMAKWITLAAREQTAAAARAPAASAADKNLRTKALAAFRVLVVDDQKSMRGLAARSLQELGFGKVDEAASGEDALKAMAGNDYDLMLADWNMDGMSGLDLLKNVRKQRDARQIVVLMTTSESHISKVTAAMEAGANNYLVKPCDTPKLRQRLERALMRSLG